MYSGSIFASAVVLAVIIPSFVSAVEITPSPPPSPIAPWLRQVHCGLAMRHLPIGDYLELRHYGKRSAHAAAQRPSVKQRRFVLVL
jgi:hypothetical protein